jgi:hypothetical protein
MTTISLPNNDEPGDLITDRQCRRELNDITAVTLWAYTNDPLLGFPPIIKIRNRNFRSRKLFDAFKARMIAKANDQRVLAMAKELAAPAREARRRKREEATA